MAVGGIRLPELARWFQHDRSSIEFEMKKEKGIIPDFCWDMLSMMEGRGGPGKKLSKENCSSNSSSSTEKFHPATRGINWRKGAKHTWQVEHSRVGIGIWSRNELKRTKKQGKERFDSQVNSPTATFLFPSLSRRGVAVFRSLFFPTPRYPSSGLAYHVRILYHVEKQTTIT